MKHWMIGVGVVVLVLAGALWWRLSPGASAAGFVFDGVAPVESPSHRRCVSDAHVNHSSIRLGGPGMRLERTFKEALSKPDAMNGTMMSALVVAGEACVKVELPRYKSMTNDPQRQWAVDYMRAACDGLDYEGYPIRFDDPLTNEVDFKRGPDAADVKARADLSRTDSFGHVFSAADWLHIQGQLPDQASYGLSIKEMNKAFEAAAKLRTCNSMQACGADSLMTAMICADVGCPYGTTLQEALQWQLSEREYEAALRLRDAFARYRADSGPPPSRK